MIFPWWRLKTIFGPCGQLEIWVHLAQWLTRNSCALFSPIFFFVHRCAIQSLPWTTAWSAALASLPFPHSLLDFSSRSLTADHKLRIYLRQKISLREACFHWFWRCHLRRSWGQLDRLGRVQREYSQSFLAENRPNFWLIRLLSQAATTDCG